MSARRHGLLGRRPGVSELGSELKIEDFMVDPLPVWDGDDDFTSGVTEWGMLGNGPDPLVTGQGPNFAGVGNCVWAEATHLAMANAWDAKEQPAGNWDDFTVWPTPNFLVSDYLVVEGGDNGTDIGKFLLYWSQNDIGPIPKLGAWVQLPPPGTGALYQSAFHMAGGLFTGFLLSNEAIAQYDNGQPFSSLSTNWAGGHGCPHLRRKAAEGGLVTWGTQQAFSWPWKRLCTEEEYMPITAEVLDTPGGVFNNINVGAIKAAVAKLSATRVAFPKGLPPG